MDELEMLSSWFWSDLRSNNLQRNSTSHKDTADKAQRMLGSPLQEAATLDHNHNKDVKTAFHSFKEDKRYQQSDDVAKPLAVKLSKIH